MNPYYNSFSQNLNNRLVEYQQYQPQQFQQFQPQQPIIRPVTSLEEVRGVTPNFDGSKMYFEDTVNKKIYSKYIDMNGLPHIDVYSVSNEENKPQEAYCTKEEYNALKMELDQHRAVLQDLINKLGGVQNEPSNEQ